jgi:hypothetical protein
MKIPTIDELLDNFLKDKSIKDSSKVEIIKKFRKLKLEKLNKK